MQRVFFDKKPSLKISGKVFKIFIGKPSHIDTYLNVFHAYKRSFNGIVGEKMAVHMTTKGPCLVFPDRGGEDLTLSELRPGPFEGFIDPALVSAMVDADRRDLEANLVNRIHEEAALYRNHLERVHGDFYEAFHENAARVGRSVTTSQLSALISRNMERSGLLRQMHSQTIRLEPNLVNTADDMVYHGSTWTGRVYHQTPVVNTRDDSAANRRVVQGRGSYVSPREFSEGNTATPPSSLMSLLSRSQ